MTKETKKIEKPTIDSMSKIHKQLMKDRKNHLNSIGKISGLKIVLMDILEENDWYIVAGKQAYKDMTGGLQ